MILFSLIERTGKLIQDKGYSHYRLEWDTKGEKVNRKRQRVIFPTPSPPGGHF